jgi:hypothetical protein
MNPVKSFTQASSWLLRALVLYVVYLKYFATFVTFSMKGLDYFLNLSFVVFAALLFVGGFVKKHHFTIISGTIIFGMSVFLMFWGGVTVEKVQYHFMLAALGFNFIARGNS